MGYISKYKGEEIDKGIELAHKAVLNDWQTFTPLEMERIRDQIGAQGKDDYALKSELPEVPVESVNGMTGAVVIARDTLGLSNVDNTADADKPVSSAQATAIADAKKAGTDAKAALDTFIARTDNPHAVTAEQVGADKAGTAETLVREHNNDQDAHPYLQELIDGLSNRLNGLLDSDDDTLDQLSELIAYITDNRDLIEQISTGKVSVSDIVDNLTSVATNKPLSANQGRILNAAIEAVKTSLKSYVSVSSQTLTESQKAQARTNIGAGTSNVKSYADLEGTPPAVLYETQELSDDQKAIARGNINALSKNDIEDVLRYTQQSLTEEQKAQARNNLGIAINGDTPQADFAQNDSTQIDYIKNRTHYRVSKLADGKEFFPLVGDTVARDGNTIKLTFDEPITISKYKDVMYKVYVLTYEYDENGYGTKYENEFILCSNGISRTANYGFMVSLTETYLQLWPSALANEEYGDGWTSGCESFMVVVSTNDPELCYDYYPLDRYYIPEEMRPEIVIVDNLDRDGLKVLNDAWQINKECYYKYGSDYYRLLHLVYDPYDGYDSAVFVGKEGIYQYSRPALDGYSNMLNPLLPFPTRYATSDNDGKVLTLRYHGPRDYTSVAARDFTANWEDPVRTWKDLGEPMPYGDTLIWDGDTTDLPEATLTDGTSAGYFKVYDLTPAKEDFTADVTATYGGSKYGLGASSVQGKYTEDGYFYRSDWNYFTVVPTDNYTDETNGITYPSAGIYFKKDGDSYTSALKTAKETFRVLEKIPKKYLPDNIGGGAHILAVDDSNYLYLDGADTTDTTNRITRAELVSMTESGRQIIIRTVSENVTGNFFVTYVGDTGEYATAFLSNTMSCYTAEYSAT